MSPTDNTPDFENMSPEEVMAWMESLAKRQGANEGFTTAADIDVPEIDPTTAVIDEPGYVPYGQEETARKSPPPPPAPPMVMSPPAAPPVVAVPPPPPLPPPLPVALPLPEPETLLPSFMAAATEPEPALETAMGENALAWLESLAADQGQSDFTLDLSSLEPEPATARPAYDPQAWLRDLQAEPEIPAPPQSPEPVTDPNAWLGELARAAGAFDEPAPAVADPLRLENPSSLLDTFAAAAGFEDDAVRAELPLRETPEVDMSYEGIQRAIHEGVVTPEQIRRFQELSMERAAQIPEPELEDEADLDMPLAPLEIPDWLAAAKPEEPAPRRTGTLPPLESLFEAVPAAAAPTPDIEIPNWLMDEGAETESVEAIFAVEVNPDDPWVEALDAEFQGEVSDDVVPDWYLRNVNDPQRIAAIEGEPVSAMQDVLEEPVFELAAAPMIITQSVTLAEAALPSETSLPAGARQAVPAWMITQSMPVVAQSEAAEVAPAEFDGLPNWLVTDEQPAVLPDWTPQEVIESAPAEVIFETQPVYAAPAPVAPPPAAAAAEATLEQARARYQTGDIDGSLAVYELLIRASQGLEAVAADVAVIARTEKNAAAFRVLGDSLMRQGRLQDALNTYREALNLL